VSDGIEFAVEVTRDDRVALGIRWPGPDGHTQAVRFDLDVGEADELAARIQRACRMARDR